MSRSPGKTASALCGGVSTGNGILWSNLRTIYTHLWFECRYQLCKIAHEQGRHSDAQRIIQLGLNDSIAMLYGFFTRKFLYRRSLLNYYLGNMSSAELDVNKSIEMFETNRVKDRELIWCYLLKISILRSKFSIETDEELVEDNLSLCIELSRRTIELSRLSCEAMGFMGADINASYLQSNVQSTTLQNEVYSPFEHNYSRKLENSFSHTVDLPISIKINEDPDFNKDHNTINYNRRKYRKMVRPAPIDRLDTYVCSLNSNIYLEEVSLSSRCHATLCNLLYERRLKKDSFELLEEQVVTGEKGLMLLRYVHITDASVRIMLLLSVGRTRVAVSNGVFDPGTCLIDGISYPIFPHDQYMEAFKTAYLIASRRGDSWDLMRCSCIEIAECYLNRYTANDSQKHEHLKEAVLYLNLCIEITEKKNNLVKQSIRLSHDTTFLSKPLPDLLSRLMANMFCDTSKTIETGKTKYTIFSRIDNGSF